MTDKDDVVVAARVDGAAFRRDVEAMRSALEDGLSAGADNAARNISASLRRAAREGRTDFQDLGRVAVQALAQVAGQALAVGLGGSVGAAGAALLGTGFAGASGRATGGAVSPGRAYRVGENGPEWMVPASAGTVVSAGSGRGPVSVTVNVSVPGDGGQRVMERTGAQVARAVRRVLEGA